MIAQGYPVAGFVVGLLVGLTGVGGGSLMTPLLILLFGVHPVTAVGTDLLQASLTKIAGTSVFGMKKDLNWRIVGFLALGSMPASALTLLLLSRRIQGSADGHLISQGLGALVVLTALVILLRGVLTRLSAGLPALTLRAQAVATVIVGAILGVLVTLTSVGAGALGMVALTYLYPRLPTARLVAADIAHAVPLTMLAGIGHWLLGSVDLALLGALLVGSIPGVIVGSLLVTRLADRVLRLVLAAVMLLAGGKLVF
ncbi:MAG TPA: sulfite exporter TauE/SafE family protein [Acetobacteraceae bacterium]|nr:sulfite exporter TauE/SafE family protein [Acetobacteraceae bacterium]